MSMNKSYDGSLYPPLFGAERMPKFTDVWTQAEDFIKDYNDNPMPNTISEEEATTVFYLLYSKYGNSTISSSDITRFKFRVFAIIFQYAPTWSKRLEIQKKLRELSDDEISKGSVQIYNDAENPSSEPSTDTNGYLTYINRQNVTHNKKGVLDSYALLYDILKTDVTEQFLNRFKNLFITFINNEIMLNYGEEL